MPDLIKVTSLSSGSSNNGLSIGIFSTCSSPSSIIACGISNGMYNFGSSVDVVTSSSSLSSGDVIYIVLKLEGSSWPDIIDLKIETISMTGEDCTNTFLIADGVNNVTYTASVNANVPSIWEWSGKNDIDISGRNTDFNGT